MAGIPKSVRSGGPKTEAGKVASSRNALKTGAYSSMAVIPGESEVDFRELHEEFLASFKPSDVAESSMVRELAVLTWKKLRLERLEQAAFVRALKITINANDIGSIVAVDESHNWLLRDLSIFTDAFIVQCKEDLELLKPDNEYFKLTELVFSAFANNPEFLTAFNRENFPEISSGALNEYFGHKIDHQINSNQPSRMVAIREARQWLNQINWVAEHLDQIKAAVASVKEKRLLDLMQDQGIMRAYDDLSRAFYRSLSELRRQQSWRQKMGIIDVSPE